MSFPSSFSDTHRLSVAPDYHPHPPTAAATMLKIQSLLNPMADTNARMAAAAPRAPTQSAQIYSSLSSTPADSAHEDTPARSPNKKQKLIKDAALFIRGPITGPNNYPPYECANTNQGLTAEQSNELALQHRQYKLKPSALEQDKISDFVRHIPYSSEKKTLFSKTGREGFNVFQYTFVVPGDAEQRQHVVMWDYQIGLVRITPFFKALKHNKTTPAKSIKTNAGLPDLVHSITGGALAAQGYWMPYACARAVCATFCYSIRWVLTPVFGPSFINDCLPPADPGFCRFKIPAQLVRDAAQEVEDRRMECMGRSETPADNMDQTIPRSMPAAIVAGKGLRPRKEKKPSFMASSPFASDSDAQSHANYSHQAPATTSPSLSPKSSHRDAGWTSINTSTRRADSLAGALLTEPRFSPNVSWRGAEPLAVNDSTNSHSVQHQREASPSSDLPVDDGSDYAAQASGSSSDSEIDDVDISISPPAKRQSSTRSTSVQQATKTVSKKFNATDARAAHWLLNLSARDAELAAGPSSIRGFKRKASLM